MVKRRRMTQEEDIPYEQRHPRKKKLKAKNGVKHKPKLTYQENFVRADAPRQNIVYFLGAGCSASFGYPVTSEIMPGICKDIFGTGVRSVYQKNLAETLGKIYNCFNPGYKREELVDIIELLSLIDYSCLYGIPPHPDLDKKATDVLKENLLHAMVEMLTEYDLKKKKKREKISYDAFISVLQSQIKNHNVSIITTNYDMSVDHALKSAGFKIDYGINYRNLKSEVISRPINPHLSYLKLHGSHNWLKCSCCGIYYINPHGNISKRFFDKKLNDDNTCICSDEVKLQPVLIAPSLIRDVRDPNLLQIWNVAQESLRNADEIIFVGYSLPAEDIAIKSLLLRSFNANTKIPQNSNKTSVILRGDSRRMAYANLFGKNNINFFSDGLDEWISLKKS